MKMRIRKKFTLIFAVSTISLLILFYIWINTALPASNKPQVGPTLEKLVGPIDDRFPNQQTDNNKNADVAVGDNRRQVAHPPPQEIDTQDLIKDAMIKAQDWTVDKNDECPIKKDVVPAPDIQMLDVYRELAFDNPDGGVWKQGWNIEYDTKHWNSHHKLKVFVVPHSHNDPGWLKTFDQYYEHDTKLILSNLLRHLDENEEMKFIWAEISYFSRWYEKLSDDAKRKVQSFVKRKQLEFVTGGWVMNDEANSHWLSILQQLSEGQTWLKTHLNVTPTSHWSIDPFGYSPTQAYLIKGVGIKNQLIQRAHYSIKKRFAQQRTLEFQWRQLWDANGNTELFTHLMPFYSYDVPHTCGPDPKICCQFDFKRLPGYGVACPWRVAPKAIDDQNVASRAALIVDQWRKKSMLYQTRSVLIPLGDDFRYSQSTEWVAQMTNYGKLFEYINSEPELNVVAKFATLQEYFDSVAEEKKFKDFPSFSGDFFTYADKDDNYWSGYYTSRPYHKRFDRVLMAYLRSAEMLHAWTVWDSDANMNSLLENGRRALSIFQHHDGVTGTAKDHVVLDYETMMMGAMKNLKHVIQHSVYKLLTQPTVYQVDYDYEYFHLDEFRSPNPDENRPTIIIGDEIPLKHVVLHNSLPYERDEIVNFYVARPFAMVLDSGGMPVPCQFDPVWRWHKDTDSEYYHPQASNTKYKLSFKVRVPAMGLKVYTVQDTKSVDKSHLAHYAKVTIHTETPFSVNLGEYPVDVEFAAPQEISLKNEETDDSVSFSKNGLLKSMSQGSGTAGSVPVHLEFLQYGVKRAAESSGAYLFMPNGPATVLNQNGARTHVVVTRGELESSVATGVSFGVHQVLLRDSGVEIQNLVDIKDMLDTEIVMRLNTNIKSDFFYTDLNAFQWIKRQRFDKLPIQANYYPIPNGIFIEDEQYRLTLLTGQSLGGSSLNAGQIEIMQDRRLQRDDNRGLGQGVMDNRKTLHVFKLILESRESCTKLDPSHPSGFLTVNAHAQSQTLTYPMERLVFQGNEWAGMVPTFGEGRESFFGIDVAVLRDLPQIKAKKSKSAMGLVLHRPEFERCSSPQQEPVDEINVRKLLEIDEGRELYESHLNLVSKGELMMADSIIMCPMSTRAIIIPR